MSAALDTEADAGDQEQPRTRGECVDGCRPCPWWTCRYHLGTDIDRRGRLHIHFDPADADGRETCALDVAERGSHTLAEVAAVIHTGRSRVHQVEQRAWSHVAEVAPDLALFLRSQ